MRDDEIPRAVKPRKPYLNANLPIIAIHREQVYIERTDTVTTLDELPALLVLEPSSYLVAHNVGEVVAKLHETFGYHPLWQYKLSTIERESQPGIKGPKVRIVNTVVNFCGFRSPSKKAGRSKYHYPIDPLTFARMSAPEIRGRNNYTDADGNLDTMATLYDWACDVRAFAVANRLRLSPTMGGIAAQLLRDKRFYPDDRRKVPSATNAAARAYLPGNYYRLNASEQRYYSAVYLDQEAAHHSCARDIEFPHPDRLFAKGWFERDEWDGCNGYWSHPGTRHFEKIIRQPGLFALRLRVPYIPDHIMPPPYMEKAGEVTAYVYSNELEMIRKLGGKILGIYAAWTSTAVDKGLNTYAEWSLDRIKDAPRETQQWLKPTLLAAYGILATKPRRMEFAFLRSKSGDPDMVPVGGKMLPVRRKKTTGKFEPGFSNVIHRGMIEAETRKRTLELANDLAASGLEVLAVYADSVFVRRNGPLPLLPQGWGVKHDLDGLRFLNSVSFTSRQLVKLPGVPREIQERYLESRRPSQVEKPPPDEVPSDPPATVPEVATNQPGKG